MFDLEGASGVILVEGLSDQVALEDARRSSRPRPRGERVAIVAIGGAQAIGNVLRTIRRRDDETRLAGLCDVGEERDFRCALEQAGVGSDLTRERMEELGFYVCDADLESELIRALGATVVENVLARNGDLSSFRTFQKQPQWQGRPTEDQLRRFFGSSAGKIKYARLLVEALDLARVPRPLDGVLAHV